MIDGFFAYPSMFLPRKTTGRLANVFDSLPVRKERSMKKIVR
jgi:hypothetical protein